MTVRRKVYRQLSLTEESYVNKESENKLRSRYNQFTSRARPTLNLPCISPQNSVTCNGEYRRPVKKAQPSFHGVICSTLKHTDPHTVRSRSTKKDGVCNEHMFRNGSFHELKLAK